MCSCGPLNCTPSLKEHTSSSNIEVSSNEPLLQMILFLVVGMYVHTLNSKRKHVILVV